MTRRDLARRVGKDMGLSQSLVREVMDGLLKSIRDSLIKGERVELRNFGVFSTRAMEQRTIKNPGTGKKIRIPAMTVVRFKAGKELKQRVA